MLAFERHFTKEGKHPYDLIEWTKRDAVIRDSNSKVIWQQENVEAPSFWSQTAIDIASSKYFFRAVPETSIKQVIDRITKAISNFGLKNDYFENKKTATIFEEELTYLLVNQYGAFNSPVWFNCGISHQYQINNLNSQTAYYYDLSKNKVSESNLSYLHPQNSACFIQSVDDTLESMMKLQQSEVHLFKYGSGTGTNFSKIRGKGEFLSSGGQSSGVISFLKGFDSWAGSIKSGGTTRRSAKMVLLDVDHPEILDFIDWKVNEEEKAKTLIQNGYDPLFTGEAYRTVSGQNSNNSVRLPDTFMYAIEEDLDHSTVTRVTNEVYETYPAKEILEKIATAAWKCADPGIQFTDTINKWHTCKESGPINASNPCSEYLFLDDSACNLASLNLLKFVDKGIFQINDFCKAIETFILAMEIIVDFSSYPTHKICQNSHDYRPLGLGYANLGGLLMTTGIPYDSSEGRFYAGAITSLLSGYAYKISSKIAEKKGAFAGYLTNKESMLGVINLHHACSSDLQAKINSPKIKKQKSLFTNLKEIIEIATGSWLDCTKASAGFRNSQISVIAPTGTIGLIMDCATTGIEPEFSLVKYKQLASGGQIQMINPLVQKSLNYLGINNKKTIDYIIENNTVENAPYLSKKYYPIFDCAVGNRALSAQAHLLMVAIVQPFISGSISKTVNLPKEATVQEIKQLYFNAWTYGVKCLAVYRDGCKGSQPLNINVDKEEELEDELKHPSECVRKKLPDTRKSIAHKFTVGGQKAYMHIGFYDDGKPGEIFLRTAKEGSTIKGLLDSIAILISLNLQHGVPLKTLIDRLRYSRFEPYGFTNNKEIPQASSLLDYIAQYLEKFIYVAPEETINSETKALQADSSRTELKLTESLCITCGMQMVINGNCYYCQNCGNTSGCS